MKSDTTRKSRESKSAALIGLMERYLNGLLGPFITLLEVHKLMYYSIQYIELNPVVAGLVSRAEACWIR